MKITDIIPEYASHLQTLGRSKLTIKNVLYALRHLTRFLKQEDIISIESLTFDTLSEYQEDLAYYLTKKGKHMEIESQVKILSAIKGFTRYLRDMDYLVTDPGERIKLPKTPKRLPKVILSATDIKKLVTAQDTRTTTGYRNYLILELLYDTSIRRFDVTHIKLTDLDLESGYIRIKAKANKEHIVI